MRWHDCPNCLAAHIEFIDTHRTSRECGCGYVFTDGTDEDLPAVYDRNAATVYARIIADRMKSR